MKSHSPIACCFAALLLAAGCSTQSKTTVLQTQPRPGTAAGSSADDLRAVGVTVKNTRIYVDVIPVMEVRDGVPVVNITHGTGAGSAALAALQEAFASRGFRASGGELTSMGLGGSRTPILLTSGPEAPAGATLPVILSKGLSGTERGAWIESLYASVHAFASGGPAPANLAASYLSPNLDRIEVFAVLSGGSGARAHIWVVAFDSRSGGVLWTGSASENAAVLDTSVAVSLVRRLVANLPVVAPQGA